MKVFLAISISILACWQGENAALEYTANTSTPITCDMEALGRALIVDTANMQKAHYSGGSPETTEGSSISAYYDDSILRAIASIHYGEMGRKETRYFFHSTTDFIVEEEVFYYARPIYEGEPEIVSRVRNIVYYCHGEPLLDEHELLAAQLLEHLEILKINNPTMHRGVNRPGVPGDSSS